MTPNWFVAWPVQLDPDWLAGLRPPPATRTFHPADLHATIAFLGGVDATQAQAAWHALPHDLGPPVRASWGDVVPLGNPRRTSALSALLADPDDALKHAIAALRGPLAEAAGSRKDRYAPKPHVTIARPTRKASDRQRDAAVRWAASLRLPDDPVLIDRIALYTWSDDRRERLFRIVAERSLTVAG